MKKLIAALIATCLVAVLMIPVCLSAGLPSPATAGAGTPGYVELKAKLDLSARKLAEELQTPDSLDVAAKIRKGIADMEVLEGAYAVAGKNGADAAQLSVIARAYALEVLKLKGLAAGLAKKVHPALSELFKLMDLAQKQYPQLWAADEAGFEKTVVAAAAVLQLVPQAEAVTGPVFTRTHAAVDAREKTEGKLSDAEVFEECIRAAQAVLEEKASVLP